MATKSAAPAKKNQDNAEANRIARLERTLKKQPNNLQVQAALKSSRIHRKTPTNPVWSSTARRMAQLFKQVTGRFDPGILSSNVEISRNALARPGPSTLAYRTKQMPSAPFSMQERIQGGAASWNWFSGMQ